MKSSELFEEITNRILTDMKSGVFFWERPYHIKGLPINAVSKKAYRGGNAFWLWLRGEEHNSNQWLTYKQAILLGGNVKSGSKGSHVFFWSPIEKTKIENGKETKDKFLFCRTYTVFNADQCESIPKIEPLKLEFTPIEAIEKWILEVSPKIKAGGDTAAFSPGLDRILMPKKENFKTVTNYYQTLLHECVHWTGHESRMKRKFNFDKGSQEYAFEELIAEMGAAFLCAHFGIEYSTQHAAYLQRWLKILEEDSKAIIRAASAAQKAVDFLLKTNEEKESEAA